MSSLRNAIPRRPHKERSQEQSRAKYGLLEKHKDYSLRARDFNVKKARLRTLRQKATDRNPDEFHFSMLSSHTKDGVKIADRGNKPLSDDVVKLLKTQDSGYLRIVLNKARKEKEKLEQEMMVNHDGSHLQAVRDTINTQNNKHTVFATDENEQTHFEAEEWFGTDDQGLTKTYNRRRKSPSAPDQIHDMAMLMAGKSPREREAAHAAWKAEKAAEKRQKRIRIAKLARYEAAKTREKELLQAEQALDLQRAKMSNNAGGVNKNGVKFKVRERKR